MRFAVFSNQASGVAAQIPRWAEKIFQLLAPPVAVFLQLAFRQPPQQAASRLTDSAGASVQARKEIVGN